MAVCAASPKMKGCSRRCGAGPLALDLRGLAERRQDLLLVGRSPLAGGRRTSPQGSDPIRES
eukprot:10119829-Heterocapsa_arctica.AAC.1